MTDRPIIFSAPMVRALVEGRKTQTRRLIKPQPKEPQQFGGEWFDLAVERYRSGDDGETPIIKYAPGDRLWVREAWRIGWWNEDEGRIAVDYCDGPRREWLTIPDDEDGEKFNRFWQSSCDELEHKGIEPNAEGRHLWEPGSSPLRWRSSIHMPRWASRLTLIVESVRVERLQDISEVDVKAEGLACLSKDQGRVWKWGLPESDGHPGPQGWQWQMWCIGSAPAYAKLWDRIHGPGAWAANPWIAAITFRVVKSNIDNPEAVP